MALDAFRARLKAKLGSEPRPVRSFLLTWYAGDPWSRLTLTALLPQKSSRPGRPVLSVSPLHTFSGVLSGPFFLSEAGASVWDRKISVHSQYLGLTYGSALDAPSCLRTSIFSCVKWGH